MRILHARLSTNYFKCISALHFRFVILMVISIRLLSSGMCCAVWHIITYNQSYPKDACNKFLWNVGNKLPGYTVSHPRNWQSSGLNILTYCYLNQQIPMMVVCGNEYKFWYLKACTTESWIFCSNRTNSVGTKFTFTVTQSSIFWNITPCSSLRVNRHFWGIRHLHF
jgi:hypothetical protein